MGAEDYPITSPYGTVRTGGNVHKGDDLALPNGTPVKAYTGGTIHRMFQDPGGGTVATVKDDDGREHLYMHLSGYEGIQVGQRINAGDVIARSGNSGRVRGRNGGYHLHYEVRDPNGTAIDPTPFRTNMATSPSTPTTPGTGADYTPPNPRLWQQHNPELLAEFNRQRDEAMSTLDGLKTTYGSRNRLGNYTIVTSQAEFEEARLAGKLPIIQQDYEQVLRLAQEKAQNEALGLAAATENQRIAAEGAGIGLIGQAFGDVAGAAMGGVPHQSNIKERQAQFEQQAAGVGQMQQARIQGAVASYNDKLKTDLDVKLSQLNDMKQLTQMMLEDETENARVKMAIDQKKAEVQLQFTNNLQTAMLNPVQFQNPTFNPYRAAGEARSQETFEDAEAERTRKAAEVARLDAVGNLPDTTRTEYDTKIGTAAFQAEELTRLQGEYSTQYAELQALVETSRGKQGGINFLNDDNDNDAILRAFENLGVTSRAMAGAYSEIRKSEVRGVITPQMSESIISANNLINGKIRSTVNDRTGDAKTKLVGEIRDSLLRDGNNPILNLQLAPTPEKAYIQFSGSAAGQNFGNLKYTPNGIFTSDDKPWSPPARTGATPPAAGTAPTVVAPPARAGAGGAKTRDALFVPDATAVDNSRVNNL